MKILQLCKKFPYPLKDGESIAVTYLAGAIARLDCEMTLLVMNTSKHYFDLANLPPSFNHYKAIHQVALDNRLKPIPAFLNLFSDKSYHVSRYESKDFEQKLVQLLKETEYDVVQLETLYLAPYVETIRLHAKAQIVLRSHNVEFEIWERITNNTSPGLKKWYLGLLTKRLKNFEVGCLNKYDLLAAITARDKDRFVKLGCTIESIVCPIGLKLENYPDRPIGTSVPQNAFNIGFIGSLDWMPNLEGVQWFLEKVWPLFVEKHPTAKLNIAGRNTPTWIRDLRMPGLVIHGEVESAIDFMTQQQVMVVPLFSGSGMRVKILESMALSRITVTTTLGVEGISAKHGENILIADTADEFIGQLGWCMLNQQASAELAQQARTFIATHYDNLEIAKKLYHSFEKMTLTT